MEERPAIPGSQIIYGEIIYWLTVVAALICMVGPLLAMSNVDNNILNPHYLFAAIFEGKSADVIWNEAGAGFPGGHFYLSNFTKGDGFTQFGLALGCSVALPALLVTAVVFVKEKAYGFAGLSVWVAFLIGFSLSGLIKGH